MSAVKPDYLSTPVSPLLWRLLWFWLSTSYTMPLLFPGSLYWVSAASVLISVYLTVFFLYIWAYRPVKPVSRLAKWVYLYLGWVALASFLSPYVWENWLRTAGYFTSTAALITALIIGSRLLPSEYAFVSAGRSYVLGALITTFALVLLSAEQSTRFGNDELLHPNSLGFLYGSALCFLLAFKIYRSRVVNVVAALVFAVLLILTFSKTSIVAILAAVAVAIVFQRGWRRVKLLVYVLIGGGITIVALGDYIQEQIALYRKNPYLVSTLTGRTVLWSWTLDMVSQRPWTGYGYATFREVFRPASMSLGFIVPATQAHNAYLDALFTGGYLGMAIFMMVVAISVFGMWKTAQRLRGTWVAAFLMLLSTFLLVRSLTEGMLDLGRDFLLLIFAGMWVEAWARYRVNYKHHARASHPQPLPPARPVSTKFSRP